MGRARMVRAQRDAGLVVQVDLVDRQAVERSADGGLIPARPPLQVVDGGRPGARQIAAGERLAGVAGVHACGETASTGTPRLFPGTSGLSASLPVTPLTRR